MLESPSSHKLLTSTALLLVALSIFAYCFVAPTASSQSIRFQQDLGSRFLQYQTLKIDAATTAAQVQQTGRMSLATSDLSFDLELTPHDMRAPGYRAEEFGSDGVARPVDTGPVRTFKGVARGTENGATLPQLGQARFTIDESGIQGLIITPAQRYFVEPARNFSAAASDADYVIYRESDVVSTSSGACAATLSEQVNQRAEAVGVSTRQKSLEQPNVVPENSRQTGDSTLGVLPSSDNCSGSYLISERQCDLPELTPALAPTPTPVRSEFADVEVSIVAEPTNTLDISGNTTDAEANAGSVSSEICDGNIDEDRVDITANTSVASPDNCQLSALMSLFPSTGTSCVTALAPGQQEDIQVVITNNSTTIPLPGVQVAVKLTGTTVITLACATTSCSVELPGTLTFVPVGGNGCVSNATGVATCTVNGSNRVNINMTSSGLALPPAALNFPIATIRVQANTFVPAPAVCGMFGERVDTGPNDVSTDDANCNQPVTGLATGSVSQFLPASSPTPTPTPAPLTLFGATSGGASYFYCVNTATGAANLIGPIGFDRVSAMDFQPVTGVLYATANRSNDGTLVLITINPSTGQGTEVGQLGTTAVSVQDMSFRNSDATLFAYEEGDLITINTSTGAGTIIGNINDFSSSGGNGMAFSPTDTLFHANQTDLGTLNQTTGARTFVTNLDYSAFTGADPRLAAMKYQSGTSNLYGTVITGGGSSSATYLATIDTTTGIVTKVGQSASRLDALAWGSVECQPSNATPTPTPTGCQASAGIALLASTGTTCAAALLPGQQEDLTVSVVNTSSTFPFPATPVAAKLKGTTIVTLACSDTTCTTELPGTLTFVPQAADGCVSHAAGVASCAANGTNKVDITMTPGGVALPPGAFTVIAAIRVQAVAGVNSSCGVFAQRAGTAFNAVKTTDPLCSGSARVTGGSEGSASQFFPMSGPVPTPTVTPTPTPPLQELRLATEADHQYVMSSQDGTAAGADQEILSIMNQVEGLYELELGLSIKIAYQSAWNSANDDPYVATNPSDLLGELSNYWNANRGSVARDAVHMWTGKDLENATIGTAYLDALCRYGGNGRAAYGLSKRVTGAQRIAITAHEIGHNLGATHPNQQVPPVKGCDNTVMNSSVSNQTQLDFCQYSIEEIGRYLGSNLGCLSAGLGQLSFAVASHHAVASRPFSVAVGDFNGDGKQDLALSIYLTNSVSILLGNDNGSFQAPKNYSVGVHPVSIASGDFNGDGKQDLAVANSDSNNVSVLLGNGDGSFGFAANYGTGFVPVSVAVGDFNGDATQDIVVANQDSDTVSVLLGAGAGGFQMAINYPVGTSPNSVAVGDFNGDGKEDLAVANTDDTTVSVLLGTGSGGFGPAPSSPLPVSSSPVFVAVGDFDGDGKQDLAVATYSDSVSVLKGTGGGNFGPAVQYPTGRYSVSVAVGDFNGDGKQDLAVPNGGSANVSVLLGIGNGGFQTAVDYSVDGSPVSVASGDFNGDGKQDLAVANASNDVSALLGTGTGSFQAAINYPTGNQPVALAVGDFNGDGKEDVAAANSGDNGVSALLGTGTGSFQASVSYPTGTAPNSLAVGDFNGDHKPDLVATNTGSNNVSVLLGTGTGSFQPAVNYQTGTSPNSVSVADFNGDDKLDLVTANTGSNNVSVLLGTGTGSFQSAVNYPVGNSPNSVAAGDFNGDGKLDLVTANTGSNDVSVLLGTGTGSFQSAVNYPVGTSPNSVVAADINGDGKPDLVIANTGSNSVSVLLTTGTDIFQPAVSYAVDTSPYSVAVGDFNRDGKPDLAVGHYGGVSMLVGTGSGSFLTAEGLTVGGYRVAVAIGDFDGNGKHDLAVTNYRAGIIVLLNTSGNSLSPPVNDNFSDARVISGPTGTIGGSTVLATRETNEPDHSATCTGTCGASIWYRWTAPSSGKFYFQTFSSSFPTVIAVYTGDSVSALTPVASSSSSVPEYVEFTATPGTTYQIAIDGVTGDTGRTVLTWNTGSLANDNFANAREIRGPSGSVNGDNSKPSNFTLEPGEPVLPGPPGVIGDFSAWYRWTAPNTGKISFSVTPCGTTTYLLGAYTGNFLDILSRVAVNYDGYRDVDDALICDNRTLRFNAVAGTTYRIQMQSTVAGPFTLHWNYADPPANDNFANALVIAGNSGSIVGTNRDATKELGEPNHAGGTGGASVWYRWTAPFSGQITFDTISFRNQTANSFRYLTALMAVYTGSSLDALTQVVASSSGNKVTFSAVAGTTYQLAIDSKPDANANYLPGIIPLHWGTKGISNDDFVNAQALAVTPVRSTSDCLQNPSTPGCFSPLLGSNAGATTEDGEPPHLGQAPITSVWYRWTALGTGTANFVFNDMCSICTLPASNARIAVYTASASPASVNALMPVMTTLDNNHKFNTVRGTTYFIAVDSRDGVGGTYEYSLASSDISSRNDNFCDAQVINGSSGAAAGDNSAATTEKPLEPNHANDMGGASVWFKWTAPANGIYTFDTFGSGFDTLLAVYTAPTPSPSPTACLPFPTPFATTASNDNAGVSAQSRVTFQAVGGTVYHIAVDGKSNGIDQGSGQSRAQTGFIMLNWSNLPPPVNDNFVNAEPISGPMGSTTGRNTVAGKEGGEPNHAGAPGGVSVWYNWTAPVSGSFTFNTFGSEFNSVLGVYTATTNPASVNRLTEVGSNDDAAGSLQSSVTFNAAPDTVYYIAVDGSAGVPGNVTVFSGNLVLNWFPQPGAHPGNDDFANPESLHGGSGTVAGTNVGGTKETGEPNHAGDRGGSSVWYSWTAPSDWPVGKPVLFNTLGSDFDTVLAVYTGESLGALTLVASNNDSPYPDNLAHVLTSSLSFVPTANTTYRIAIDGSGGRSGNFSLRWGREVSISGHVQFLDGVCGIGSQVTMILSGEDSRAISFTGGSNESNYSFAHLRMDGNYSIRGVMEVSAQCFPLFLERTQHYFALAGDITKADFTDDRLRGGGATTAISGTVRDSLGNGIGTILSNRITLNLNGTTLLGGSISESEPALDNGNFGVKFTDLDSGNYTITPSCPSGIFNPTHIDYPISCNPSCNQITAANFEVLGAYTIEGQACDGPCNGSPNGVAGVSLSISGSNQALPAQVTTGPDGYYSFFAVTGGNYTVTAEKDGMSFATAVPMPIMNLNANQKNVDFTPAAETPTPTPTPIATPTPTPTATPTTTPTPIPLTIQLSLSAYAVGEGDGHVTVTVTRSGDASGPATVDYRTTDTDTFTFGCANTVDNMGSAYARCDFATVVGALTFTAGETSKSFDVPIIDDSRAEGNETFTVVLSNPIGATLGAPSSATVTIIDNDAVDGLNPILQTNDAGIAFFVRQHYLDFLGREPEAGEPWSAILRGCADQFNVDPNNPSAGCDRILVSGDIFGSPEFKDKGFYVIDSYRVAFGRLPQYSEFVTDLASLAGTTAQEVFARRAAFANNFVQRPEFATIAALPNSSYVMTLMAGTNGQNYNLTSITTPDPDNPDGNTKVALTTTDLINRLNANTLTKAQVLRAIVQSDEIINIEAVSTFVASQYYGYLRRTPDTAGFNSWVNYLTTHPTDFRTMVNGFMNSIEYRLRFGTPF